VVPVDRSKAKTEMACAKLTCQNGGATFTTSHEPALGGGRSGERPGDGPSAPTPFHKSRADNPA